jgi:hypothetical protein
MKTVSFRFDVDTLTCIKSGIPKLIDISNRHNVEFTFFMNFGKSIDREEVLKRKNKSDDGTSYKLSTFTKLGIKNYIITVLLNPKLGNYKKEIKSLANSNNEIGLHGGKNHGTWQVNGSDFNLNRLEQEIDYGVDKAKKFNISLSGFTSPGMISNKLICRVLEANNFNYISDTYSFRDESSEEEKKEIFKNFKNINVNLAGKNGTGYFEYFLSKGLDPKKIKENLLSEILNSNTNSFVVYDHPLIINFIQDEFENLIEELKKNQIKFIKMGNLN